MSEVSTFPLYRKYANNKSYFKILAEDLFEEVQVFGKFYAEYRIQAEIYPDKLRIMDMMACKDGLWEESNEEAFNSFLENCRSSLQKSG